MRKLNVYTVDHIDHLVQPSEFHDTTLTSPALQIFNDFKVAAPAIVDADTPALEASEMMKHEHATIKLVGDAKQELIGLISTAELSTQNIMQHVSKDVKAADLLVSDLMRRREDIIALSYQQLQHCSVGDVLNTLQHNGEPYCVVIDLDSHQIRGVISAREIATRLHVPAPVIEPNPTFLSIFGQVYA